MTEAEAQAEEFSERAVVHVGRELKKRYTVADLAVFTPEEARRYVPAENGDPRDNVILAWELLYRLEPELYDRLATVERLHPEVVRWLPVQVDRIAEVGAGTGRLTMELVTRARHAYPLHLGQPCLAAVARLGSEGGAGDDEAGGITGQRQPVEEPADHPDPVASFGRRELPPQDLAQGPRGFHRHHLPPAGR